MTHPDTKHHFQQTTGVLLEKWPKLYEIVTIGSYKPTILCHT